MRTRLKLLALFTSLHAAIALGALVYAMADGSARFDNPDLPPAFGAGVATTAAELLLLPGRLAWTSWASRNLPNVLEWALLIGNSALWGAGAVSILGLLTRGDSKAP